MSVSTHILDCLNGRPAGGVAMVLARRERDGWCVVAEDQTGPDGRLLDWQGRDRTPGIYLLRYDVAGYFAGLGIHAVFPCVGVVLQVTAVPEPHHVRLLLSPYSYSVHRTASAE